MSGFRPVYIALIASTLFAACSSVTVPLPKDQLPEGFLSAIRRNWSYSSAPELEPQNRGQVLWFTTMSMTEEINPSPSQNENLAIPVLNVIFIPSENAGSSSWCGLVSSLTSDQLDLVVGNYLEIWVNDHINFNDDRQRRGEMLVDIGQVSEDAVWDPLTPPSPPNGDLDDEDRNRDGLLEISEDLGLDGVRDMEEPPTDPSRFRWSISPPEDDPSGDNRTRSIETDLPESSIAERIQKYKGINGTEDNDRLDTEDLNRNYFLDVDNDYWEYRIDLSSPALLDPGRDLGVVDPRNGWRKYWIDLEQYDLRVGDPGLSTIKNIRIWFRGIEFGDALDIQVTANPLLQVDVRLAASKNSSELP